jgi:uncharacterized alpha-E superfamily protein
VASEEHLMLLSRVAESVYWTGRYLERVEAAARLVRVHTELYIDLPMAAGIGWAPLLLVTGTAEDFGQRHEEDAQEEDVVAFLTIDEQNPGSIVSSLDAARLNLRITRDQFPPPVWEILNELHLWVRDNAGHAVERRHRSKWSREVIRRCQLLNGLLADGISHDEVHSFLEIGRFVERADMTTRVLDVQAGVLLGVDGGEDGEHGDGSVHPYADVTWKSVLESLAARHAYHRSMRSGVSGPGALRFLLRDAQFPRSVEHCLTRVSRALLELPAYDEPMAACAAVEAYLQELAPAGLGPVQLHEAVDELQRRLGHLHDVVATAYFQVATPAAEATLALA